MEEKFTFTIEATFEQMQMIANICKYASGDTGNVDKQIRIQLLQEIDKLNTVQAIL